MNEAALWNYARVLMLVAAANGAPVIGKRLFGRRFGRPLDGGLAFLDGRPLLGPSKTVRGIVLAVTVSALASPLLGLTWQTGVLMGVGAMLGDLLSSFLKRRLGMASSSQALGLDQIPESFLPMLVCRTALGLSFYEIIILTAAFVGLELLLSRLFYKLGVRDRPY